MIPIIPDPLVLFESWYQEAQKSEPRDANAMTLATVNEDGQPDARIVLLKDITPTKDLVFYTNVESRKGQALLANPKAAFCFHWKSLNRQVRISGPITQVSDEAADGYYASRHRMSRIGAWASQQSKPLGSMEELQQRVDEFDQKYPGEDIPRPPHWSGFAMAPNRFEFWDDGQYRLHERIEYLKSGDHWQSQRLYP